MSRASSLPTLAITLGDHKGIGAEIILKALASPEFQDAFRPVLIGQYALLESAAQQWAPDLRLQAVSTPSLTAPPALLQVWDPTLQALEHERDLPEQTYIREAAEGCVRGDFDAMVTAPICKEAMYARGFRFPGHTEYLAHVTGSEYPVMAFSAPGLRVSLVTVHEPLKQVPELITPERVLKTLRISAQGLRELFCIPSPRLALCGLNPHAGENGHLGDEEIRFLQPALAQARAEGIDVTGPLPADTVFGQAVRGRFDLVVALYHDQGLIPVKLLCFGESVNLTLGLPIVRTSVDHGVAYDIAGKGIADASSMCAALRLALELANTRKRR